MTHTSFLAPCELDKNLSLQVSCGQLCVDFSSILCLHSLFVIFITCYVPVYWCIAFQYVGLFSLRRIFPKTRLPITRQGTRKALSRRRRRY